MKATATYVIDIFGGHRAVAAILKIDVSRVYRWTYSRDRGGSSDTVPYRHRQPLLDEARARQLPLTPADFFDIPHNPTPTEGAAERAADAA